MKLLNVTANQHFLSQVEQRLNSCNPNAKPNNQMIYAFEIQRCGKNSEIKLGPATKKSIANNLSLHDLFSFDVEARANLRHNFEMLFHKYEQRLHIHTEALLKKSEVKSVDIEEELIALFSAKFLNFMRNPYSIPKILDTFLDILDLWPTDPKQDSLIQSVLNGRKPQQAYLCKQLGISDIQYQQWLRTLFMMLSELSPGQESLFDRFVHNLFTDKKYAVGVAISMYTKDKCLLSDRSFSTNCQDAHVNGFDFNLKHNAFIRFIFAIRTSLLPSNTHPNMMAICTALDKTINVSYFVDDMALLRGFNMNVINQSHSHVYCSVEAVVKR